MQVLLKRSKNLLHTRQLASCQMFQYLLQQISYKLPFFCLFIVFHAASAALTPLTLDHLALNVALHTPRPRARDRRQRALDVEVQVDTRNQNFESDVLSTG